jgi:hypothetical protein
MFNSIQRFILTLSVFALFSLFYFIVIFTVNYCISEKISIAQKDILIVGDSHLRSSLNPLKMNSAINICQNAEPYYLTYLKLKFLLQKNVKPDTLIIGFGHQNLSNFNDYKLKDKFWNVGIFDKYYLLTKDIVNISNIDIDYLKLFIAYSRNMCLIPRLDHYQNFIGQFEARKENKIKENYQKRIDLHYFYKDYGISDLCISYLDSIIDISEQNQITPILLGTPVTDQYYQLIPEEIIERYALIKAEYSKEGIRVIDLTRAKYSIDYFYDSDHLNFLGAKKFSEEINFLLSGRYLSKYDI